MRKYYHLIPFLVFSCLFIFECKETNNNSLNNQRGNYKQKQVHFEYTTDESESLSLSSDFDFGEPMRHKQNQNQNQKLKSQSILKSSLKEKDSISKFKSSSKLPSSSSSPSKSQVIFSSKNSNLEKAYIINDSTTGSKSTTGPTPEFINTIGPDRFWLPPNAPIQKEIPGPWLPYYQGVPGGLPYENRIRVEDSMLPQVQGLTGPRDQILTVDPISSSESSSFVNNNFNPNNYIPPYRVPCNLPPINQIPLVESSQFQSIPSQATGVNLINPNVPTRRESSTLINSVSTSNSYIAEFVIDPIVFFDPITGQTVIFDPINNITRAYNPEIDPELPAELINENNEFCDSINGSNSAILKSGSKIESSRNIPSFWILKKTTKGSSVLEKSGNNGNGYKIPQVYQNQNQQQQQQHQQQQFNPNENSNLNNHKISGNINGNPTGTGRVIFNAQNTKQINPSQNQNQNLYLSLNSYPNSSDNQHLPTQTELKFQLPQPEQNINQLIIQQSPKNPNTDQIPNTHENKLVNSSPIEPKKIKPNNINNKNNTPQIVTLVYSPIVDIEMGKKYKGFKANRNNAKALKSSPETLIITFSIFMVSILII